ncbi:LRR receptor-like kinase resistance protein [Trifolium pratense]|uniref:LRR receptor-like kinase resistance protein n=1 Tax=Trifolium pratense TaxID=57577 RepID=A0A2K3NFD4_TRIPR|nr:LRR receptor-like kinase resistance protein [Trifolium pratense]
MNFSDLSSNQLNESLPSTLSEHITTIDLSNNELTGTIPSSFSSLPHIQKLSLANNSLIGSVPSTIWQDKISNETERFILELENNQFTTVSGNADLPQNVTVLLYGNPLCSNNSLIQLCRSESVNDTSDLVPTNGNGICRAQSCPPPYEFSLDCFCAAPLLVRYRLKSPGFSDFVPFINDFEEYLTTGLSINMSQLNFTFRWEAGPRLRMDLKFFPVYFGPNSSHTFNETEVQRIKSMFTGWNIPDSDLFGPYELLNFNLGFYQNATTTSSKSGISTGAIVGIVLGAIACAVTLSAIVTLLILRTKLKDYRAVSKRRRVSKTSIKMDGVRSFTYEELSSATNNFSSSAQVGQGGYGKVYKGIISDGTAVAIKRAQEGSLQGEKEFLTEISLLSRLHHRNLVSLIGYCDEEGEQMLVYEYMPNGTLRDHLSVTAKEPLTFIMRLKIALGSAKGLMYLHNEADPPIFHRDVKASNILLDSKLSAKVADFGLSRLAPVPDMEGIVPGHVSTVVKGTPVSLFTSINTCEIAWESLWKYAHMLLSTYFHKLPRIAYETA